LQCYVKGVGKVEKNDKGFVVRMEGEADVVIEEVGGDQW